jgi:putative membrane protein
VRFLVWLASTAAALALATWLLDGMSIDGDGWREQIGPLLLVALIMGAVGLVVKPIVTLLSLPFVILTLGLFLLVINAWMLMIVGWIADKADIGFQVDGFWTALLGAIIITLTESFLNAVLED